jgi:hypothetical protein
MDDKWRQGMGGIAFRRHPVRLCVPSTTFFSIRSMSDLMFNFFNYFLIWYNQESCGERSFRSAPSPRQQGQGNKTNQEAWHYNGGLILSLRWMSREASDEARSRKEKDFKHLH